jgi:BirA family biotin operon repressor/biotin-[acetyl-CoA-carboxylase] ligase
LDGGPLTRERVAPLLRGRFGTEVYRWFDRCPSTQLELAPEDPEGAVAVAEEQTAGRGRLGRSWQAPHGSSVLCSLLLSPAVEPARLPELTVLAAEAVVAAIAETTGLAAAVKHPNDVLVGGRKVCGALGEARDGVVVLGIGVNVNVPPEALPPETRLPASSLSIETGTEVDRAALLASVLDHVERLYDSWHTSVTVSSRRS